MFGCVNHTYKYGQDSEEFFIQASSLWNDMSDCDLIVGGGDINARTRTMIDFIPEIDGFDIPPRSNPDNGKNAHADSFLTFLKDIRAVILNGRITPECNDFTFVSNRGCSVPDYMFCSIDNLKNCVSMKTHLISSVINKFKLFPPKSIPDHSILSGNFVTSYFTMARGSGVESLTLNPPCQSIKPPKKNLSKMSDDFMMSQETFELILQTIQKLDSKINSRKELDKLWSDVKQIFTKELNKLPNLPMSNSGLENRKVRRGKAFWNDELDLLWNICCNNEREYLRYKVSSRADMSIKNKKTTGF